MQGTKKVFELKDDFNGAGNVVFAWSPDSSYIAAGGENHFVYVLDRRGKKIREIMLQNPARIIALDWDKDNEFLCILQENSYSVSLWNVFNNNSIVEMEVDSKAKVSFIRWAKTHPVLAMGTDKGGFAFYNKKNQKKVPTIGKHSKRIISGDWNKEGLLISGGEDRIMTISDYNGDTKFESVSVKSEPRMLQWVRQKTDDRDELQRTITAVLNQKSLLMFELNSNKQPLELVFEQKYGKIIDYSLFGDGYIVIGFNEGYVAHISTHIKELKDEVSSEKIFQTTLDALCTNDFLYKMAAGGENTIKIFNMHTWKEIKNERIEMPKSIGKITKLQWANNGQLLVVSTSAGHLYGYLTSVPNLTSVYLDWVCMLTSFTEVTIMDCSKIGEAINVMVVNLESEPAILSNGPYHLAAGINNMVWYYLWFDNIQGKLIKGKNLLMKRDYLGSVKKIVMNSHWTAVFIDGGRCVLHPLSQNNELTLDQEKRFPATENEKPITQIAMTDNFLIMLDTYGKIKFFYLPESTLILEYKPDVIIARIYPNPSGTKTICVDNNGNSYMFFAHNDSLLPIQNFPTKVENILWDNKDPTIFCAVENESVYTFSILKNTFQGTMVTAVRELLSIEDIKKNLPPIVTILDKDVKPLILSNGYLHCFTQVGTVQGQYLASHSYIPNWKGQDDTTEGNYRFFLQNLMLHRYSFCLEAAGFLKESYLFEALGRKCLQALEFNVALRSFQSANNLSMVLTIQSFSDEGEKMILLGNVAMILGDYDMAQELFLKSTKPILALNMRCDIQDWLLALNLAKTIAPEQEPIICRKLAMQIESQGNYNEAQRLYEKAILKLDKSELDKTEIEQHNVQCFAGISRTSIKLGDVTRGYNIANELADHQLVLEIALVCENMKQLIEAAQLYMKGNLPEKAANIYISLKMFNQATPLLDKIKSPKLLIQLAKAKENEAAYKEAESAYEKAEDWENVIRMNINFLDNVEKAKAILRNRCPTTTCAAMVASYCEKRGSKKEAIEFLLMAGKKEEAFILAQSHGEMETYSQFLQNFTNDDVMKIAQYYEGKSQWGEAAKNYEKATNYSRALKLYLQGGEEYYPNAIKMIGTVKNDNLTNILLDFLMGAGGDGTPKDPLYTYQVYRGLGMLKEAAKIAITIAEQDQEQGNYKTAHTMLYETYKDMKENNLPVNWDLYMKLMILHSYIIVRRVVKLNEHKDAARLLNRICKNISQFPAHAVNILTTAVVEATRASLKLYAYQWSCVLVRPEYRPQISDKYKGNIENIARRPVKEKEDVDLARSPCPFCKEMVPEFDLQCPSCQNNIPFCVASGKHIVVDDCCFCPNCKFPSNSSYMRKILESENACPMCNIALDLNDVQLDPNALFKLKSYRPETTDEKAKEETKDNKK